LSRDLLAYLAITPAGASADTLQEHLIARHGSTSGRAQMHTAVSHTRALLRTATGCRTAEFIVTASGRYRLDPGLVTVDVDAVSAAVTAARRADHDADRVRALGPVVALCRAGTPLEGITGAWAEPVRESLRQQAIDALVRLARLVGDSDPDHAVEALSTAVGLDPYAERLYQHMMRLHVRAGRPTAAHAVYRLLEARLADIDAEPDPATMALLPAGRGVDTDHHARRSVVP
jgi:DNA-binding SARP family transcriptional activator